MTNEEKQLLLIDLCARLPYGVKIQRDNVYNADVKVVETLDLGLMADDIKYDVIDGLHIKPYLRPISSMTDEEKEELYHYYCKEIADNLSTPNLTWELRCCISNSFGTDWLNAHHFDYRGLIPMGLALEARGDMYKTK